ncbi:MAG: tripartite tricarboxylate transporter TctB family protein [Sphaerochaeta sp.]
MSKKNIGLGIFVIVLGIAMYLASFGIKDFAAVGVGATFFPRLASIGFVILGTLLIIQVLKQPQPVANANPPSVGTVPRKNTYSVILSLCLLIVFLALLETLGYVICSTLYIFFQILILTPEKKKKYLLYGTISALSSLSTYLLFARVFQVMIPNGILG